MTLNVYIDDQLLAIDIPPEVLEHGEDFFAKMDRDMDLGWKIGPTYVEDPDQTMRVQIAADKMVTAMDTDNRTLLSLMAGYIVTRIPDVKAVRIADGDPLATEIITA
ncbi:MAG: hypothetical protein GWO16_05090 [Gammaproteobacteria bacterium]|nr:hypothetical protein [Gammaproteobacteria bacterium]NIR97452.1 hypothetical protein [Gammaproteobacteria bacterium]NIT63077.1 hypothetical protein [Gammaproteobacteria bacterium]NIV20039.1 hypothetical protein [Gammaproteobacteria bacterium]NIX10147.1 hypothetical protein [Gammaproteobacteria bacterium]